MEPVDKEALAAHLAAVRERLADPATDAGARARMAQVNARLRSLHVNELAHALQNEKRPKHKFVWLKKIGDALGKATAGIVPCGAGCSDCCHMPTMVSTAEERQIAQATGKRMVTPPKGVLRQVSDEPERALYTGVPCTLLKDGKCSIYEHRPWACRVHHSLDRDNLLCKIVPGEHIEVPMLNPAQFNVLLLLAHGGHPLDIEFADIRAFFPGG